MSHTRRTPVVDLVAVRAAEARIDQLVADHPEVLARTVAMLAGELACPDLEEPMTRDPLSPVNIRLPQGLLDRADALIPDVGHAPELETCTTIKRADVIRAALARGLRSLEAESKKAKP